MADESRYVSDTQSSIKRKYEEPTYDSTPPSTGTGRRTGFSSGPISTDSASAGAAHPPSYNSVPPPPAADDVQTQVQNAKLRAQEIASRLLSGASTGAGGVGVGVGGGVGGVGGVGGGIGVFDSKRARVENGGGFYSFDGKPALNSASSIPSSYGYGQGTSKKIDVPNGRVGVIIGKAGETIKYLQLQSGAKIQVTRDMDADPNSSTRTVELMGTPEQIAKAEQLINDVLAEAEAGGSAMVSRRVTDQYGSGDPYVMKVPNNKVGLVIGKGGETIKNMQARTGARIQVIPLHLPPGDTSNERNIHIDGTPEQIEAAKQLINEATSENRMRNQGMSGGYSQHNYQARPPASWGAPGDPQMQQPGYGYGQPAPGMYSGPSPQYNMGQTQYGSYPTQSSGGYNSSWDQSAAQPSQHGGQGGGYDYYNQQAPQQQQQQTTGGTGGATDNLGYGYSQPPTSYGQGYSHDGYGGYHGHPSSGYGQPPHYDQQGDNTAGYNTATNPSQEGHTTSYGSQGDSTQAQPAVQPSSAGGQGYGTGYPQAGAQPGYGVLPVSQAGYGSQPPPQTGYGSYGPTQGKPPGNPSPYGQAQQSLSTGGGYGQPPAAYSQTDAAAQRAPPSGYSAGTGPVYGSAYGLPTTSQPGYGQPPPQYYSGGYQQPAAAYSADGGPAPPTSQAAAPTEAAKASPPPS